MTFLFWAAGVTPPKKSLLKMIVLGFSSLPPTLAALCFGLFGGAGELLIHWFSLCSCTWLLIKIPMRATRWTNLTAEEGQYLSSPHGYHRSVTTDKFSCYLRSTWHRGLLQENLPVPKQKGKVVLARSERASAKPDKFVTIYWDKNSEAQREDSKGFESQVLLLWSFWSVGGSQGCDSLYKEIKYST